MITLADELQNLVGNREQWGDWLAKNYERVLAALRSTDALAVPREPTQNMINAVGEEILKWDGHWDDKARKLWQIMYDAAQGTRSKP